jgi:hypothetical protein
MMVLSGKILYVIVVISVAGGFFLTAGLASAPLACSYYASPDGGGNGRSQASPFKIANFWRLAGPGRTLCLLDGVYTDAISPPENLNGTASARITITALNDGGVRIDGRGVGAPIKLKNNDYFLIEGINAHNGLCSVVLLDAGADNNIVRRVVAWDAKVDGNCIVWQMNKNTGNLLEDVAGFGTGRKMFESYTSSTTATLTVRRAWGRWEGSTVSGPKMTFAISYNSSGVIFENVIGTWSEQSGTNTSQMYGILAMDRMDRNFCANSKYLGSIAYVRGTDRLNGWLGAAFGSRSVDCFQFKDVVLYLDPPVHSNLRPIRGQRFDGGSSIDAPVGDRRFDNITEIGGTLSSIATEPLNGWQISNHVRAGTVDAAPNIWNGSGSKGARVCKRYVNGTLTNNPLWPWPMNQRIIDAMKSAGKTPVDVTKTMEEIFGPIPSECRTRVSTLTLPNVPTNLSVK